MNSIVRKMKTMLPLLLIFFPAGLMTSSIQPFQMDGISLKCAETTFETGPQQLGLSESYLNGDIMLGDEPENDISKSGFDTKAGLDESKSTEAVSSDSWAKLQISPDNIFSLPYGNFRINVYEHSANQRKAMASSSSTSPLKPLHNNKYYYAPITLMDHDSATSSFNNVTKQAELMFRIEFWNDDVQKRVTDWIKGDYDPTVNTKFVEVIPFNKMTLISASTSFQRRYKMSTDVPYGQQRSVWFKVICSTIEDCQMLSANMRENSAQFSDFRVLFSLDSEKAQVKQTIVRVESILSGNMASKLNQQISGDTALLTSKDEQVFLQESATNILLETFDDSDVPARDSQNEIMNFIKDNLLAPSRVVLRNAEDKMWESVFMNEDNYRPDLTTKTMNDVFSKLNTEEQRKLTDTFKDTNKVSVGGSVGVPGIVEVKTQVDTDLSREGSTSTEAMDKFLQEMKDNAQWDGSRFVPKPMSLSKVNMAKLRDTQTFQGRNVRVRYSTAVLSVTVNIADHADLFSTNRILEIEKQLEASKTTVMAMLSERPTRAAVSTMIMDERSHVNSLLSGISSSLSGVSNRPSCYREGLRPSSCEELRCLGHKASGFYSVKSPDGKQVETIFCNFKSDGTVSEDLIGSLQVTPRPVYFSVQRDSMLVAGASKTIGFQVERVNIGKAMDLASGIFTAPQSGIYSFSFSCLKLEDFPTLDVSLQVNGRHVAMASATQQFKAYSTAALGVTLRLNKNDNVYLELKKGGIHENTGIHFTHFSGSLLMHEDLAIPQFK